MMIADHDTTKPNKKKIEDQVEVEPAKQFLGPNFGPNGPKSGPKLGFLSFSQVWFISFLLNCKG